MNEYVKQAKDFLTSCNATMEIKFMGLECPNWDSKPHATYDCTIKTPKGEMKVHFYDSVAHTETLSISFDDYCCRNYKMSFRDMFPAEQSKARKQWKQRRNDAVPTEYDILACLQKYEVGSMEDFFQEFGFEIKSAKDMTNFFTTYNAVVEEYRDICRCFTPEQIEAMQEIQ